MAAVLATAPPPNGPMSALSQRSSLSSSPALDGLRSSPQPAPVAASLSAPSNVSLGSYNSSHHERSTTNMPPLPQPPVLLPFQSHGESISPHKEFSESPVNKSPLTPLSLANGFTAPPSPPPSPSPNGRASIESIPAADSPSPTQSSGITKRPNAPRSASTSIMIPSMRPRPASETATTLSGSATYPYPRMGILARERPREATEPSSSEMAEKQLTSPTLTVQEPSSILLHPSSARQPARRNTTGSHRPAAPLPLMIPHTTELLDSDILKEAEQIRKERRAKAQKEVLGYHRPTDSSGGASRRGDIDDNKPLVGNLIGEDHANYVLMYNMLTGIRIGVSRCGAKIKRPLTDEDYTARHKFSFDIIGNELTPSAKYDFKFKDYAPWVFRELREDHFHLDPADYLLSLTSKYILTELGSPGKSGSFFYFSRDYRFIIKTIHHSEHKFLISILKDYYNHVKTNPHTLLSRFYGLHRVKLPHGKKIHFVIMNNLFPPHRDIHETYDLKGSTVGREYSEEKAAQNPRAVLKDLNWINRGRRLELGPEKRALLSEQLRRDTELLKRLNVMDYSLLVGIHNMQRGNRDNLRSNTLKVFQPHLDRSSPLARSKSSKSSARSDAIAMRRAMATSDPKSLKFPERDTVEDTRRRLIFYQDEGGYRATDEANHPMDTLYYLGIIDILTPYTVKKKIERIWKGMKADRHKISPVPAEEYGDRFYAFLNAVTRGGEGGDKFKPDYKPKSE